MSTTSPLKICPVCDKSGLKHLSMHLRRAHKLTCEESKQMLIKVEYIAPASAGAISGVTNTNFTKNESYPCTSDECNKHFSHRRSLMRHMNEVHGQDEGKYERKRRRTMNEYALKEVNKVLRWFSKTVHCRSASYAHCEQCNDFKRHVNFMLRKVTL